MAIKGSQHCINFKSPVAAQLFTEDATHFWKSGPLPTIAACNTPYARNEFTGRMGELLKEHNGDFFKTRIVSIWPNNLPDMMKLLEDLDVTDFGVQTRYDPNDRAPIVFISVTAQVFDRVIKPHLNRAPEPHLNRAPADLGSDEYDYLVCGKAHLLNKMLKKYFEILGERRGKPFSKEEMRQNIPTESVLKDTFREGLTEEDAAALLS